MTRSECAALVIYLDRLGLLPIRGDGTHEAWFDAIGDLRAVDATEAARRLARTSVAGVWLRPGDIRRTVAALRAERVSLGRPPVPEPDLSGAQYARELADWRQRVGDGCTPHQLTEGTK